MSEIEKKVLDTFGRVLPKLSEENQKRFLIFGEGIAVGVGVMEPEESTVVKGNKQTVSEDPNQKAAMV